jgi:uncharacterized RDD family membrane protein YckC
MPYCASCKNEQLLDVQSGVRTSGSLNLADPLRRFVALLLDGLIVGFPLGLIVAIVVVIIASSGKEEALMVVLPFVWLLALGAMPVYEGIMLSKRGQTFGKMAMKIKVVRIDGSDITTGQAWGRAAMRAVMQSCLALINYLPAFFTQEKTALHDMVASTRVVNWS